MSTVYLPPAVNGRVFIVPDEALITGERRKRKKSTQTLKWRKVSALALARVISHPRGCYLCHSKSSPDDHVNISS